LGDYAVNSLSTSADAASLSLKANIIPPTVYDLNDNDSFYTDANGNNAYDEGEEDAGEPSRSVRAASSRRISRSARRSRASTRGG
jgi:hypothetical protein